MKIVNGFLSDYELLKGHAQSVEFSEQVNDVDGAVYPAISFDIPDSIRCELISKIEAENGFKITPKLIFLRANPKGAPEPYQAHNDLNMAEYTCIVYLCDQGGTAFVTHKETGMDHNQPEYADEWARDCNKSDAWEVTDFCPMKQNRALFFDATMMHRGEPVEGYGEGKDSRMIMVCFYDAA